MLSIPYRWHVVASQTAALEWSPDDTGPAPKKKKKNTIGLNVDCDANIFDIKWRRIVLDEGHIIKNPRAKMTQACNALIAE